MVSSISGMMTSTETKYLMAASLAWTVYQTASMDLASQKISSSSNKGNDADDDDIFNSIPNIEGDVVVDDDEDDDDIFSSIPEIEGDVETTKNCRVTPATPPPKAAPMMVTPSPTSTMATLSSPTACKISAATMQQMEARRRKRSAIMASRRPLTNREGAITPTTNTSLNKINSPPAPVVVVDQSAEQANRRPTTDGTTVSTTVSSSLNNNKTDGLPPPAVVNCVPGPLPIQFKVKSITTGTVLRFQCVPTFQNVQQNIIERLGGGDTPKKSTPPPAAKTTSASTTTLSTTTTSSFWSAATNTASSLYMGTTSTTDAVDSILNSASTYMTSTVLDYSASSSPVIEVMEFQDEDGDWCSFTTDEDLQDALDATMGRQDAVVRLRIKEPDTATRVWNSFTTQFGW